MSTITGELYTCIACDQQVTTIGGCMEIKTPLPLPNAVRICEPCSRRMAQSAGFRRAVEAKMLPPSAVELLSHLVSIQRGLPLHELQRRSLELSSKNHRHTRENCATLDKVMDLPDGTHWEART